MVPAFVMVNVTVPAGIVAAESSTFHSDRLAVTAAGSPAGRDRGAAAATAAATNNPAMLRSETNAVRLICAPFPEKSAPAASYTGKDTPVSPVIPAGIIGAAAGSPYVTERDTLTEDALEPTELERFEAVVLPHLDAAYNLARYLTRDADDAQDIVQEASLRAFRYFAGFRGTAASEGRAWLLAIVRNTARTWRDRNRHNTQAATFDEEQHSDAIAGDHPEAAIVRQSEDEAVRAAIDRLPTEFREVIVLRELEGLSYKEISDVAGVPVGTVMSRLSRARRRLEEALCPASEDC